jgi:hypothetical protein
MTILTPYIEMANRALEAVGADPISSLDDTGKAARLCKRLLPQLRDELLEDHPYPFARARASVAASATAPAFGFATAYPLPADCLRVLGIDAPAGTTWAVEGNALLTDISGELDIFYLRQVTDPGAMAASFCRALSDELAVRLCMPLTGSDSLLNTLENRAARSLIRARANANLQTGIGEPEANILDARNGGTAL